LILFAMLLFAFVGGSRVSYRLLREARAGRAIDANGHPEAIPVLIYGAGYGGALLVREIRNAVRSPYVPIGFIDDDNCKTGRLMHGYWIFSPCDLPYLVRQHRVREVLISSAKIPDHKLKDLRQLGVAWRRVRFYIA
jgi:UDP-GlcNAc:undecaprenyl-phosphate GlcNAc-1-phosphate transferase